MLIRGGSNKQLLDSSFAQEIQDPSNSSERSYQGENYLSPNPLSLNILAHPAFSSSPQIAEYGIPFTQDYSNPLFIPYQLP